MHRVKCPYCGEYFNRDVIESIKVNNRYYHVDCYNKKMAEAESDKAKAAARKPNEKICPRCKGIVDIKTEEYRMVGKRYYHLKCFNEVQNSDDKYIDMIYQLLGKTLGIKYDYVQCEKQRVNYNKKGLTNETIYNTLVYIYRIKKMNPAKAEGRIGLVPFMYEEATNYFKNIEKHKKVVDKAYEKQKKVVTKKMNIVDVKETKRKGYIDIETIGIDEVE